MAVERGAVMAPRNAKDETLVPITHRVPAWIKEALRTAAFKANVPVQKLVCRILAEGLTKK